MPLILHYRQHFIPHYEISLNGFLFQISFDLFQFGLRLFDRGALKMELLVTREEQIKSVLSVTFHWN